MAAEKVATDKADGKLGSRSVKPLIWKRRIRETLRYGRPGRAAERLPGPVVLMYHGVVNQIRDSELDRWNLMRKAFIRHLDYLTRHYEVVPLSQAVQVLGSSDRTPENSVALTFDDALTSVYEVARPLLRERRLPYTVAVPAGLMDSGQALWCLELQRLVLQTQRQEMHLEYRHEVVPLKNRDQRLDAARGLLDDAVRLGGDDRGRLIRSVKDALSASRSDDLSAESGSRVHMTGQQLKELAAEGATFAAHGYFHSPLNDAESPSVLRREICEARTALESLVQRSVDFFVYPYGVRGTAALQTVREAGYRAAFTTRHGCLQPGQDPRDLPRIAAECGLTHLRYQLAQLSVQ
jgi:peptidoglycan/xylan/chitin deacetylase (PgdA/CDA1 family)